MNGRKSIYMFALIAASISGLTATDALAQAQTEKPSMSAPSELPAMSAPTKPGSPDAAKGSIKFPSVTFTEPRDGATVSEEFTVSFKLEGTAIGQLDKKNPPHAHVIIDGTPVKSGQRIPMDAQHIHLAPGETQTKLKLKKGEHKLTIQFADANHMSYGTFLSETITVTVK